MKASNAFLQLKDKNSTQMQLGGALSTQVHNDAISRIGDSSMRGKNTQLKNPFSSVE